MSTFCISELHCRGQRFLAPDLNCTCGMIECIKTVAQVENCWKNLQMFHCKWKNVYEKSADISHNKLLVTRDYARLEHQTQTLFINTTLRGWLWYFFFLNLHIHIFLFYAEITEKLLFNSKNISKNNYWHKRQQTYMTRNFKFTDITIIHSPLVHKQHGDRSSGEG